MSRLSLVALVAATVSSIATSSATTDWEAYDIVFEDVAVEWNHQTTLALVANEAALAGPGMDWVRFHVETTGDIDNVWLRVDDTWTRIDGSQATGWDVLLDDVLVEPCRAGAGLLPDGSCSVELEVEIQMGGVGAQGVAWSIDFGAEGTGDSAGSAWLERR